MTTYSAYFDASGSRDTDMMAVAGYISKVEDWKQFEVEWNAALTWAKVPYFHMRKFIAHQYPFTNQKWKREELRRDFLKRLIGVIARNVDLLTLNILPIDDWKTVNAEYRMEEERLTPFSIVGCGAMLGVEEWSRMNCVQWEDIDVIFEDGDLDKGDFASWCKKDFNKMPLFAPTVKDEEDVVSRHPVTPLEACDFIAWEARRAETDVKDDPPTYELRKCFAMLLDRLHHHDKHEKWNANNLRKLCIKHDIKKR
jgi:hypothetical protein